MEFMPNIVVVILRMEVPFHIALKDAAFPVNLPGSQVTPLLLWVEVLCLRVALQSRQALQMIKTMMMSLQVLAHNARHLQISSIGVGVALL